MEVTFQTTLGVPDVSPAAMDARITEQEVRSDNTVGITNRGADLATMSYVANVSRANHWVILPTATSYAASIGQDATASDMCIAGGLNGNVVAIDVPDAVCSLCCSQCCDTDVIVDIRVQAGGKPSQIGAHDHSR
jgi:hypothetical protein